MTTISRRLIAITVVMLLCAQFLSHAIVVRSLFANINNFASQTKRQTSTLTAATLPYDKPAGIVNTNSNSNNPTIKTRSRSSLRITHPSQLPLEAVVRHNSDADDAEEAKAKEPDSLLEESSTFSNRCQYSTDIKEIKSSSSFWNQPRFQNIDHDDRLDSDAWYESLLDPWSSHVVDQTICVERSPFLNTTQHRLPSEEDDNDVWHVRLLYWGFYLHQHLPALQEMEARRACQQEQQSHQQATGNHRTTQNKVLPSYYDATNHDYQCHPDTKYLVVTLPAVGSGATFRSAAVPALLAGISSGRVVVFVNQKNINGTKQMKAPWKLASCPRGDYQCFFLPISPCVLTVDEIQKASLRANESGVRDVLNQYENATRRQNERVIVADGIPMPAELDLHIERKIRRRIYHLIKDQMTMNKELQHLLPTKVLEEILLQLHGQYAATQRHRINYRNGLRLDHALSKLHQAALLYIFRPHNQFRQLLEQEFHSAIPQDLDTQRSFGLPIRASDKCGTESMCLTFAQYMQLTRQQYEKYINATNQPTKIATVILTSEQASIVARRHNYSTSTDFPFQFVVNEKDAGQGTGEPEQYGIISGGPDADKIMLSTLVALKMQLMAKYTVVNCCSSFHRMILDLLRAGCGAAAEPEFRCLQEMEDPQYHLCCKWDQDEQCQQAMLKFRDRYENATQNYS